MGAQRAATSSPRAAGTAGRYLWAREAAAGARAGSWGVQQGWQGGWLPGERWRQSNKFSIAARLWCIARPVDCHWYSSRCSSRNTACGGRPVRLRLQRVPRAAAAAFSSAGDGAHLPPQPPPLPSGPSTPTSSTPALPSPPTLPPFPPPPPPGYIGEFEFVDNHRSGKIVVELVGRLNKTGAISPRYDIAAREIEAWVGRLLPSRQVGCSLGLFCRACTCLEGCWWQQGHVWRAAESDWGGHAWWVTASLM